VTSPFWEAIFFDLARTIFSFLLIYWGFALTDYFEVEIAGCHRRLSVVDVTPVLRIAFLDILGDIDLLDAAIDELLVRIGVDFDVILGGDTVGLVVAHHFAIRSAKPYVAARKKRTPDMLEVFTAQAQSVAANAATTFWLDRRKAAPLKSSHVLVVDEVTSTGSTLAALRSLALQAGASRVTLAVVATEGVVRDDVVSLVHLPTWSR
jgi:adenine phosphoribosyltransferase